MSPKSAKSPNPVKPTKPSPSAAQEALTIRFRVKPDTYDVLGEVAAARGCSRSVVAREAVIRYLKALAEASKRGQQLIV